MGTRSGGAAGKVWVSSLLALDPAAGALTFNGVQTFPHLQIRYPKADALCAPIGGRGDGRATIDPVVARRRLLRWWVGSELTYLRRRLGEVEDRAALLAA